MVVNFNLQYSLKCIPICSDTEYQDLFVARLSQFVRNVRWRAWHALCPDAKGIDKETFGFKSRRAPPTYNEGNYGEEWESLKEFELRLYDMLRQIRFAPYSNELQKTLQTDLARLKKVPNLIIHADKTRNAYEVTKEQYDKLMVESITKDYQKVNHTAVDNANHTSAVIAQKYGLADRMMSYREVPANGTLKDHKDSFPDRLEIRLLNGAKSDMGVISKILVQRINKKVMAATGLSLWRDNTATLKWFDGLADKHQLKFIVFDIV